ncbi:hypothetical protein NDU88_004642 [Pleurodeles waltl]|uniref:Uncharacterized protein n=1 Tax=Pleurodeles waltl TaxID=8319 RepID=A0AAV7MAM9_PLEWA|nr:hypothetical protein NDU88_004642 [Pleurodeles waltl]
MQHLKQLPPFLAFLQNPDWHHSCPREGPRLRSRNEAAGQDGGFADAITNPEYKQKAERPLGPDTKRGERDTENAIGTCADPGTQDQVSGGGRRREAPAKRAGPERKPMRGPAEVRRNPWASVPIPPSERREVKETGRPR